MRLPPEAFWAMTPAEFHAAAGGLAPRTAVLSRAGLVGMMERFPDRPFSPAGRRCPEGG
ncbi:phage tail assembly chaperone [Rhizobium sp. P32RR-XVIII]|uniref:phage tail assembly chaperone n=1 Tax=Rhizobium sp. P32RR-XVIII TaxID=2726738 RepID=UPI001FEF988B